MRGNETTAVSRGETKGQSGGRSGFFRQFLRLAGRYWTCEGKWKAWLLTAVIVALTVAQVVIPVAINIWSEKLFDALEQKAMGTFVFLIGVLVVIIGANLVVTTTHLRMKRRLQISWRTWLTRVLLREWMTDGRHYQVAHTAGEHDNPDGRIAEDIRIATEFAIDLAHSLLYCLLLLVSFTNILWALSGPPQVDLGAFSFYLPGHLVWVALVYAAAGTAVALLLGRPLVRAVNRRQTYEANFRFGLVHARENALAIALLHGEADERRRFRELFQATAAAWNRQTAALSNIFLFTSSWSVLSQVFPILVAAPRYIAGTITLGGLMQTAQAFQQMIAALSWPIDNLAKVAEWRASVERVLGLHEALAALDRHAGAGGTATIAVEKTGRPVLAFHDVTIAGPDGRVQIGGFSGEIGPGERVLISGDPGAAIMLFKVVAGLWPWGSGRIEVPSDAAIFFMPQRPYLPIGPLRNALSYPAPPDAVDDERAREALERVGLDHLASRLDEPAAWEQVLAVAEQQRLGFARLLLHRPNWIFIQEATDALDGPGEEAMMILLEEEFPKATVITIGHHATLAAHHRRHLVLLRRNGFVVVEEERVGGEVEGAAV